MRELQGHTTAKNFPGMDGDGTFGGVGGGRSNVRHPSVQLPGADAVGRGKGESTDDTAAAGGGAAQIVERPSTEEILAPTAARERFHHGSR